jgi:NAD(P)H-flavin reductase
MASPPSESGSIDLVVRELPGGAFSAALDERLAPGDRLRVSGPVRAAEGPAVPPAYLHDRRRIRAGPDRVDGRRPRRPAQHQAGDGVVGVRTAADLFHLDRLEAIGGRMPGLEIVPVLSEPGPGWTAGCPG